MAVASTIAIVVAANVAEQAREEALRDRCSHTYVANDCDGVCVNHDETFIKKVDEYQGIYSLTETNRCLNVSTTTEVQHEMFWNPHTEHVFWGLFAILVVIVIVKALTSE